MNLRYSSCPKTGLLCILYTPKTRKIQETILSMYFQSTHALSLHHQLAYILLENEKPVTIADKLLLLEHEI